MNSADCKLSFKPRSKEFCQKMDENATELKNFGNDAEVFQNELKCRELDFFPAVH